MQAKKKKIELLEWTFLGELKIIGFLKANELLRVSGYFTIMKRVYQVCDINY